ncbi:hypothetical protein [Sphingomonas bacterium]|uniref:hypothetical protein n=1 Tax=Sphingomonas bacterium TaxID=1895847 RepID=UPI002616906D|nr:hypothetical protein [Sphingomonas bacterium]MDB5678392.1 hypothetical protein [Sphingomonas bacterium]
MFDDIDTRVSPALDPETYRAVEGYNDTTRMFVDDVVNAFNDIYVTVGKVHDARQLAEKNPAWTPENRILIVGQEANKQKDRAVRRLALAERDLRARIAHTECELTSPLTERAGLGSLNGEVRSFVRGLDRSKREAFMREALERDDGPTLEAILGAQPFLSGLTPLDHEHFLRLHHVKRNPHLVVRLDLMKRFLDMIERNGSIVHVQFDKAIGAKPSVVGALQVANDQALAALKIEPTG